MSSEASKKPSAIPRKHSEVTRTASPIPQTNPAVSPARLHRESSNLQERPLLVAGSHSNKFVPLLVIIPT